MDGFSLREAVNAVLDSSALASPQEVAAQVASELTARQVRAALSQALPGYVAQLMQQRRTTNPLLTNRVPAATPVRSAKVTGIRDAWSAALRDRVHVDGGWKLLGECGTDDLLFAAAERREHAAKNVAKAEAFEALAERLRAAGAATVADLPHGDAAVLGAAA